MSLDTKEVRASTRIPVEKCNFTWRIENFSLCSHGVGEQLTSPIFTTGPSFTTTWYLTLYPRGRKKDESEGKIGIYLTRTNNDGSDHYAIFKISLMSVNQVKMYSLDFEHLYDRSKIGWGAYSFLDRKVLFGKEKNSLLPDDILTVHCELKVSKVDDDIYAESSEVNPDTLRSSSISKLDLLSTDLREIYDSRLYSDFSLKVDSEEYFVHKLILTARSPVFAMMLKHDMKEKLTNCVEIPDLDPVVVKTMLDYMYSGRLSDLTPDVAIQLYYAAERYAVRGLRHLCVDFLLSHLTVDNICDVLSLGDFYDEPELMCAAKNFVYINAARIYETEKWLQFSQKKPDMVYAMNAVIVSSWKKKRIISETNGKEID